MLPNWLYTQQLLTVELAAAVADPAADRAALLARLRASLGEPGRRGWEQHGRAFAALGAASPPVAVEFARELVSSELVVAAMRTSAAVGIATSLVRASSDEPAVSTAVTEVLTAQAALLRVLSMLDLFQMQGKEVDATVRASFHTVVRGAAAALVRAADLLPDGACVRASIADLVDDKEWSERVARTLTGDWTSFEGSA